MRSPKPAAHYMLLAIEAKQLSDDLTKRLAALKKEA